MLYALTAFTAFVVLCLFGLWRVARVRNRAALPLPTGAAESSQPSDATVDQRLTELDRMQSSGEVTTEESDVIRQDLSGGDRTDARRNGEAKRPFG